MSGTITIKVKDDLVTLEGRAMRSNAGVLTVVDIENDLTELPTLYFKKPDRSTASLTTVAKTPASGDGIFQAVCPVGFFNDNRGSWKVQALYKFQTPNKTRYSQVVSFEVGETIDG